MTADLRDLLHLDVRRVLLCEEEGHAVGGPGALVSRCGACDDQQPLGALRAGDPHLLTIQKPAAVDLACGGADSGRVESGGGLGDRERDPKLPFRGSGQEASLEFFRAVLDQGQESEDRHVYGATGAQAATRLGDRLHHDGGGRDPEAAAAVLLRQSDAEEAGPGHRLQELVGELVVDVLLGPVVVGELGAVGCYGSAQFL